MSQTPASWHIYQSVPNDFRSKYDALPRQTRILVSIFIHQLAFEDEPELFPDVFACGDEDACSFMIGDTRIIFRAERIAQGFTDLQVLHFIDILRE